MESDDGDEAELLNCAGISEQNFGKTEELNCSSLHEALSELSLKTQPETEKEIQFFVQRSQVLKNAFEDVQRRQVLKNAFEDIKTSKMVTSKVSVEFVGEPVVDTGVPRKKCFPLPFINRLIASLLEVLSHISPFNTIKCAS